MPDQVPGQPRLDPTLQEAELALTAGRLDRAEDLFLERLEAEPSDALAAVGLAQVALERDDDARALELGRWALRLDPANDQAVRFVSRLEEVMRYRGEEPPPASPTPPDGLPTPRADSSPARRPGLLERITGRSAPADREEP